MRVRDGATPWQMLVAATRNGAAMCGVGAELGTMEAGMLADLIVVGEHPLENITSAPPAVGPERRPGRIRQTAFARCGP